MVLDTCVLSEVTRPDPDAGVLEWFEVAAEEDLYLSVLTVGEIRKGAHALPPGTRRDRVLAWLSGLVHDFADRLLVVDDEVAMCWGELSGEARRRGVQISVVDGLIAATALRHGHPVVTRNVEDFRPTGVPLVNPWSP